MSVGGFACDLLFGSNRTLTMASMTLAGEITGFFYTGAPGNKGGNIPRVLL